MLKKIKIKGIITVKTGMHIGASEAFAAIGAIDSPVVIDQISKLPYIPGSTLKGKMRSLLAKKYNGSTIINDRNEDDERITRLFGCSKDRKSGHPKNSRLIFSDTILSNEAELKSKGLQTLTEAKDENTINPLTSMAMPRTIERVVRGAQFPLNIIYNAENDDEIVEDMGTLAEGLKLLEYDYIGGHGSRGYGRIEIDDIELCCVIGDMEDSLLEKCSDIVKGV